jgi:hypothetical protein
MVKDIKGNCVAAVRRLYGDGPSVDEAIWKPRGDHAPSGAATDPSAAISPGVTIAACSTGQCSQALRHVLEITR